MTSSVRAVVILSVVAAVLVITIASWRSPDTSLVGSTQTSTGPLGAADRDMLAKVKQAGLWEMPAGAELAERAHDPMVRAIGRKISDEHMDLDRKVTRAAIEVGAGLPSTATEEQQVWVAQIRAADYPDEIAVNLLRQAHGGVLPLLAQVKVGTRNATIRDFAGEAMVYVGRHIGYLESTGLVDFTALPEPPLPSAAISPVKASYYRALDSPTIALAIVAMVVITVLSARAVWPRRPTHPETRPRHARGGP